MSAGREAEMLVALTREVSSTIEACQLTHVARAPIDAEVARAQHRSYEDCLADLGCRIQHLAPEPHLPDAVFVEDTAVVLDEMAIVTRPGAAPRRAETESVSRALATYRRLRRIEPPGTLDGGDVLRVGRVLYVGLSTRTNENAIQQLREHVEPLGYAVRPVAVNGCLHLKSAVTQVALDTLLLNRAWVDARQFKGLELLDIAPAEPMGANALLVGDTVLCSAAHEKTLERLRQRGISVKSLDMSELAKAEGGLTCCSLIFDG
jgi:dimethylargininase